MAIMHFVGDHVSISLIDREDGAAIVRVARETNPDEFFDLDPDEWFELNQTVQMIETARAMSRKRDEELSARIPILALKAHLESGSFGGEDDPDEE